MCLLFLEMGIVCFISFRNVASTCIAHSAYVPLVFTNLGVTNVGIIGANEFIRTERKERDGKDGPGVNDYINETNRFVKLSSITAFLHHTIVLWAVLGMVIHNPVYFEHWGRDDFILNNYDGFMFENIYWVFSGIIGLGFIGLL